MSMGRRIERAIVDSGLEEQKKLAEALGVSDVTVWRWVHDQSKPQRDMLERIARATGKPVGYFYGEDAPDPSAVTIAGVQVTGPAGKLAEILSELGEVGGPQSPAEVNAARLQPNERHTGLRELLRLHAAGTLEATQGIALSADEEAALRTYGRSGPAVATLDEALRVVRQWRAWDGNTQAPADAGPEPGVVELERSAELRAAWRVTADELDMLRAFRCLGAIRTARQALRLLDALRLEDEAAGVEGDSTRRGLDSAANRSQSGNT